jgi:geranylgeranyl diphosphate synthase type II
MEPIRRIEQTLGLALAPAGQPGGPPRLAAALRHAVFPPGARIRPRLCLAVAMACGDDAPELAEGAAGAIELLHCASLVHDDLPCFDDAPLRRGRPSVHRAFGERLAVLAGDALIVVAFELLAARGVAQPTRLAPLIAIIARAVAPPSGIAAGQAWECEPAVPLSDYQRAKTGALFAAATMGGACAAGHAPAPWRALGECLGEAFQVADDIQDVVADPARLGKPVGRDAALGRPSAVRELGIDGAVAKFDRLVHAAIASIPACPGADVLTAAMVLEASRLLPEPYARRAA